MAHRDSDLARGDARLIQAFWHPETGHVSILGDLGLV